MQLEGMRNINYFLCQEKWTDEVCEMKTDYNKRQTNNTPHNTIVREEKNQPHKVGN